jgi:exosortase H (IPTLxxWG-CTERM-specific)
VGVADSKSPGGSSQPEDRPEPASAPRRGFLQDPWFRFAGTFGLLAVACEVLYYAVLVDSEPLVYYLRGLAFVSGKILWVMGFDASVDYTLVTTEGFSVQIAHGCDAIQICALYSSAVIAFPTSLRPKLRGLFLGIAWLQLLNQARIVSLVLIGRYYETIFENAHYTVWPSFLIVITVVSWIVWVRWATRDVAEPEPSAA